MHTLRLQTAVAAGLLCCGLLGTRPVSAVEETPTAPAEAAEPVLEPPELLDYIQADYPAEALATGLEAVVLTQIDIDENGRVTAVSIVEPAGYGFDEAAVAAIEQFVFKPALQNGEPIPATVLYRYTFFLTAVVPPEGEAPEPLPATLMGTLHTPKDHPLTDSWVTITKLNDADAAEDKPPPESLTIETDASGRFKLTELEPGRYEIDAVAPGYMILSVEEQLSDGEIREVIYRLEPEKSPYETVVRGRRPPRELTRREVTRREITRIPGTGGDALRAIQSLPGMARAPSLSGALIVRGSSPGDSRYFFDSLPVPMLYHFGGLTSIINSDLLERIDFYPGNYSLRYGGATGGIVDVYPRQPATDRIHAYVDVDFWDIGALFEAPVSENWSLALSARRSYVDTFLRSVLPEGGGFDFTLAPRYYDYQVIADYHPSKNNNLRLFLFGSDDRLVFIFGDTVAGNPNFGGGVDMTIYFHQLQARWDLRLTEYLTNQLNAGFGYQKSASSVGEDIRFDTTNWPFYLRDEFELRPIKNFVLRTGVDLSIYRTEWIIRAPEMFPAEGEQFDPISANDTFIETDGQQLFSRTGAYSEVETTIIPNLRLIGGLRFDHYSHVKRTGLDPRLVARYKLKEKTTLKGGIGIFHQPPLESQADEQYGNPDLDLTQAVHYGLGVEQRLTEHVEVGLEGFYKDIDRLVVSSSETITRDGELVPERFNNDGRGQIYGLELLVKHQPTERFFGWVSYTLMRSNRIDHPGEEARLFDFDQTHILTLVASAVLGRGWEAGVRFRLVSGNPITPVTGSAYDGDSDIYWPIYGQTNSDRLPIFHQLDIRIDKNWQFKHLKMAIYIDVQNIYNRKNPEGHQYNYDYSQRSFLAGLPVFPSLGLKLEY